jgi:GDPmannose 4,6-dehydratase
VTRKITRGLARIHVGMQDCLYLGNMNALRDWGHARDFVRMQWLMLQQDEPEDFVIATGEQHSVREFVDVAARELGLEIEWRGSGVNETGVEKASGRVMVAVDPRYYRPTEVETLLGDPTKAREKLGWEATISFPEMVREMVGHDLQEAKRDALCMAKGFAVCNHNE